ncbi:unnamed protein product [Adineta steineri]|nr:unnamed protein product [Adineta steineri]CAF1100058.1 unnamed protein product [Adineta steineri]CAF1252402.1 unnamed protein product [Adineta steineri]CAF1276874.1 unnamed protein product [Adineta steineri]CAF3654136.1 unnamed protein product [Adineta steineri]
MIVLLNLAEAVFTDVPPPPKRPDHFRTKDELKRYLQKLHEYHMILGRWRSRRNDDDLFRFSNNNNDHYTLNDEISRRLKLQQNDEFYH